MKFHFKWEQMRNSKNTWCLSRRRNLQNPLQLPTDIRLPSQTKRKAVSNRTSQRYGTECSKARLHCLKSSSGDGARNLHCRCRRRKSLPLPTTDENPMAVTTLADTIGAISFSQYFANKPKMPSIIPPMRTVPIIAP